MKKTTVTTPPTQAPKELIDKNVSEAMLSICHVLSTTSVFDVTILLPGLVRDIVNEAYLAGVNSK